MIPSPLPAQLLPCHVQTATGSDIVIEERPASELKTVAGVKIAPDGIAAWNPAFDVTPAALITAIVTDKGVLWPKQPMKKEFDVKAFCESSGKVTYPCGVGGRRERAGVRGEVREVARGAGGGSGDVVVFD